LPPEQEVGSSNLPGRATSLGEAGRVGEESSLVVSFTTDLPPSGEDSAADTRIASLGTELEKSSFWQLFRTIFV